MSFQVATVLCSSKTVSSFRDLIKSEKQLLQGKFQDNSSWKSGFLKTESCEILLPNTNKQNIIMFQLQFLDKNRKQKKRQDKRYFRINQHRYQQLS